MCKKWKEGSSYCSFLFPWVFIEHLFYRPEDKKIIFVLKKLTVQWILKYAIEAGARKWCDYGAEADRNSEGPDIGSWIAGGGDWGSSDPEGVYEVLWICGIAAPPEVLWLRNPDDPHFTQQET